MGVQKDQITFTATAWNDEAAAMIAPLVHPLIKHEFRRDVDQGRAVLWRVSGDDWVTWLVTRIEQFEGGHIELVLEVIAGKNARAIVAALTEKVKKMGVKSIRFETHHPEKTAARLVGCLGFERVATTFRLNI
ncbi:MAG: hypothetical protein WA987_09035 [Cellvibrio sp.]